MTRSLKNFLSFLARCGQLACDGDWRYYAWTGGLFALCLVGLNAYAKQFVHGLITTDIT
ncbi:MAG: polysulfide reductase, partial [Verrucomicrobia bacterium]|nr:polysulfide reductase [Verrucomicrobiota bacterium]